ncbi:sensor histidine kinase [Gephyromycinifex aptenodytis]|uniref:sensor histidine kinase n=1 Tax=Gephyromycinifex aptenodytis TaxID=2716227 RepID=UPI001446A4D1|nr:histidine kinase [Gephyromycinifex aptenodytis]
MDTFARPAAPPWLGTVAKYAAALLLGLSAWALVLPPEPEVISPTIEFRVFLDLILGTLAVGLLPLRRRAPLAAAAALSLLLMVSAMAFGSWVFATISLATHRRVWPSTLVVILATLAGSAYEWWIPTPGADDVTLWEVLLFGVILNTLVTALGFYLGARRDLLASLRDRAETAEREQLLRIEQARVNERSRIAREMHDVLAHRISLVALHAGALAYREDLGPEQTRETAHLVQENAHRALTDLREVLGVLRAAPTRTTGGLEPPQPTLSDLSELITQARAAGQSIDLQLHIDPSQVPTTTGRHAYRGVQECLTNARKHAPGTPVTVTIDGHPGGQLRMQVSNPLAESAVQPPPGAGVGLLGLAERAELTGGSLQHGTEQGRYLVCLSLPWADQEGE